MSNPFAALFEDVDQASDPMLAEAQLNDVMFAPLSPPEEAPAADPAVDGVQLPALSDGPVRETIAPIRRPSPAASPPASAGTRAMQAALVVVFEKRGEPDLNELNDLLASGWRVVEATPFQPMDGGGRSALLVIVEQKMPQ